MVVNRLIIKVDEYESKKIFSVVGGFVDFVF